MTDHPPRPKPESDVAIARHIPHIGSAGASREEQIAAQISRDVAELSDRTSPDDWPEAMLVTQAELEGLIINRLRADAQEASEPNPSLHKASYDAGLQAAAAIADRRAKTWVESLSANMHTECGMSLQEECEDIAVAIRKLCASPQKKGIGMGDADAVTGGGPSVVDRLSINSGGPSLPTDKPHKFASPQKVERDSGEIHPILENGNKLHDLGFFAGWNAAVEECVKVARWVDHGEAHPRAKDANDTICKALGALVRTDPFPLQEER